MAKKKPTKAEKEKRVKRLKGGFPLATGKTPAKPPKTGADLGASLKAAAKVAKKVGGEKTLSGKVVTSATKILTDEQKRAAARKNAQSKRDIKARKAKAKGKKK